MWKSLKEVRDGIAEGRLSSVDLTEEALEQAGSVGGELRAFVSLDRGRALETAREADEVVAAGGVTGSLHGVPVSLKDLIGTEGLPTTGGSRALDPAEAPRGDAELVKRLRRAGAVLFGKTNLNEFAYGVTGENQHFGDVRNPWDPDRLPGGSSSGSAAAVCAGIGFGSVGTDTRGSIRIPASCCGVTGLKPTRGRVSMAGVFPLSWTLDHAGPLARTVEDAAILFEAMAGSASRSGLSGPVREDGVEGLRVGLCPHFFDDIDHQVEEAVRKAVERLEGLGLVVVEVEIPELDGALGASGVIAASEALAVHDERIRDRPDGFDPVVLERLERGYDLSALELARALRHREELAGAYIRAFQEVELMVGPTLPGLPVRVGSSEMEVGGGRREWVVDASCRLTAPQNMTGTPALSVPCGFSGEGLPIGLQLWGPPGRDDLVLDVGRAYQEATDWHLRHPPLAEGS